jgi:hypothetical protein
MHGAVPGRTSRPRFFKRRCIRRILPRRNNFAAIPSNRRLSSTKNTVLHFTVYLFYFFLNKLISSDGFCLFCLFILVEIFSSGALATQFDQ